jgi:NAD(P)-dependent dehydrogenase (short-subunit alcohol dehydrogenase family)
MRKRGSGRVLFVSSILGRLAIPLIGAYAASKWALEALAETLAMEVGHFGVTVSVLQPGSVTSGGAERALTLVPEGSPYRPLLDQMAAARGSAITVEEAAMVIADAVEQPHPPLRIPVGAPAATVLGARKAASEEIPFEMIRLDW